MCASVCFSLATSKARSVNIDIRYALFLSARKTHLTKMEILSKMWANPATILSDRYRVRVNPVSPRAAGPSCPLRLSKSLVNGTLQLRMNRYVHAFALLRSRASFDCEFPRFDNRKLEGESLKNVGS